MLTVFFPPFVRFPATQKSSSGILCFEFNTAINRPRYISGIRCSILFNFHWFFSTILITENTRRYRMNEENGLKTIVKCLLNRAISPVSFSAYWRYPRYPPAQPAVAEQCRLLPVMTGVQPLNGPQEHPEGYRGPFSSGQTSCRHGP